MVCEYKNLKVHGHILWLWADIFGIVLLLKYAWIVVEKALVTDKLLEGLYKAEFDVFDY